MRSVAGSILVGAIAAAAVVAPAGTASAAPTSDASASVECPVSAATLTWGFKESFRSYISGTIARGTWVASDGATYTTPSFGWSNGSGSVEQSDSSARTGTIAYTGSVRFTGHGGVLDTTIANPKIELTGPTAAVLHLDVRGTTQDGVAVDERDVPFADLVVAATPSESTVGAATRSPLTIDAASATLTAEGAAAFGSYDAGTVLDPVSAVIPMACPASVPTSGTRTTATSTPSAVALATDSDRAGSSAAPLLWTGAGVLGAAAAVTAVVVRMRRRHAGAPARDSDHPAPEGTS